MTRVRLFALCLGLIAVAGTAFAQTPLPPARPAAAHPAKAKPPAIKPPPAPGMPPSIRKPPTPFDPQNVTPDQAAIIQRINTYFNSIRVMSGNFVQVAADGGRTTGQFWIAKPGRLRFEYAPPSNVQLIADGRSVVVRDRALNTQDIYYLSQTPLRFLLADQVDLLKDTSVVGLYTDDSIVAVTMEETHAIGGSARIQLMFNAKDYILSQWTITDAQGYDTTVAISDVDTSSVPDKKLFYIDEIKMR